MNSERSKRKRERNKRRRHSIQKKRKERLEHVHAVTKELKDKKKELVETKSKLAHARRRALAMSKAVCKAPKERTVISVSPAQYQYRPRLQTKPTASSGLCSSARHHHHTNLPQLSQLHFLDLQSLMTPYDGVARELGSGTFGKCTKMILSGTAVAVKTTTLKEYSYDCIMYEARVMVAVCRGHPNLPLFIGVYQDQPHTKPLLVMKFYSVAGEPCTFHQYLRDQSQCHSQKNMCDWVRILLGICNGLDAIHTKGFLHNDLKSDNIVLSDSLPMSKYTPSLWPIIIDFGKARSMKFPKTYKLSETEKTQYLRAYTHLAPDLVLGKNPQSVTSDIYSLGVIIGKVAVVTDSHQLKCISKLCINLPSSRPSIVYVQESLAGLCEVYSLFWWCAFIGIVRWLRNRFESFSFVPIVSKP